MIKIIFTIILFLSGFVLALEKKDENNEIELKKTLFIGTSKRTVNYDKSPREHHFIDYSGEGEITIGRCIFHHIDVNNRSTNFAASFHEFAKIYAGQFHFIQIAPEAFKDIDLVAYKDIVNLLDESGSLLCSPNHAPEIVNNPNFNIIYKYSNKALRKELREIAKNSEKNDLYMLRKLPYIRR